MAAARRVSRGRGRWISVAVTVALAIVLTVAVIVAHPVGTGAPASSALDPNPAALAGTAGQAAGVAVDGIASSSAEQVLVHIRAHLAFYVNGTPTLLPYGIGIVVPYQRAASRDGPFVTGGSAFYWLHTHDELG